jgi:hypothetical protein
MMCKACTRGPGKIRWPTRVHVDPQRSALGRPEEVGPPPLAPRYNRQSRLAPGVLSFFVQSPARLSVAGIHYGNTPHAPRGRGAHGAVSFFILRTSLPATSNFIHAIVSVVMMGSLTRPLLSVATAKIVYVPDAKPVVETLFSTQLLLAPLGRFAAPVP